MQLSRHAHAALAWSHPTGCEAQSWQEWTRIHFLCIQYGSPAQGMTVPSSLLYAGRQWFIRWSHIKQNGNFFLDWLNCFSSNHTKLLCGFHYTKEEQWGWKKLWLFTIPFVNIYIFSRIKSKLCSQGRNLPRRSEMEFKIIQHPGFSIYSWGFSH